MTGHFFLIMKLTINSVVCNTDTATPLFTHERTTTEQLTPRVTLIRKELPYHLKYNKDFWFTQVIVEKYIDGNLVKTYSWLQSVTPEEKEEFLKINNPPRKKPEPTPAEKKRKEYLKNYYEEHKEKYRTRYSSPEYMEKKKKYREEHKEEYNERAKQYYYRHREEKLKKIKEYQNKMKEIQNN